MTAPDRPALARDLPVPPGYDPRRYLSGTGAVLAGGANVIMQLSWPGIGYGVMNSPVRDGSAMLHPWKRARTTFTYIAVALLGTDEERADYRRAVSRQHARVVSGPDEPVTYRALDPGLQTWVAACLYYGSVDLVEKMHGSLAAADADAAYLYSARFGTTLQMPAAAWPPDRVAFARYWEEGLTQVRIDPPVREYLLRLSRLENFPQPLPRLFGRFNLFVTTGFLPPPYRAAVGLSWSAEEERRFARLLRRVGAIERRMPTAVRIFPFNLLLADLRRRRRRGLPLV